MDDNVKEQKYSSKEMTSLLDITSSELSRWCLQLENNGYEFLRFNPQKRTFIEYDIMVLKRIIDKIKIHKNTSLNAVKDSIRLYGLTKDYKVKKCFICEEEKAKNEWDDHWNEFENEWVSCVKCRKKIMDEYVEWVLTKLKQVGYWEEWRKRIRLKCDLDTYIKEVESKRYDDFSIEMEIKNLFIKKFKLKERYDRERWLYRNEMKNALVNNLSEKQIKLLKGICRNSCSLSGIHGNIVIDHFIPLAWGHGGTYIGNVLVLNKELNGSKSSKNPFEWIKQKNLPHRIVLEKWNWTIERLAMLNNLTVDEFREYVYWCEKNKRTLEEVKKDKRMSVNVWKEFSIKSKPGPSV